MPTWKAIEVSDPEDEIPTMFIVGLAKQYRGTLTEAGVRCVINEWEAHKQKHYKRKHSYVKK